MHELPTAFHRRPILFRGRDGSRSALLTFFFRSHFFLGTGGGGGGGVKHAIFLWCLYLVPCVNAYYIEYHSRVYFIVQFTDALFPAPSREKSFAVPREAYSTSIDRSIDRPLDTSASGMIVVINPHRPAPTRNLNARRQQKENVSCAQHRPAKITNTPLTPPPPPHPQPQDLSSPAPPTALTTPEYFANKLRGKQQQAPFPTPHDKNVKSRVATHAYAQLENRQMTPEKLHANNCRFAIWKKIKIK